MSYSATGGLSAGVARNQSPNVDLTTATDIRDWVDICPSDNRNLRQASFRGVPFYVTSDDTLTGRRIQTHEFPNRDIPFQEDLGQKAVEFKVKAYIYGANVESWKDTLLTACADKRPAVLILPYMDETAVVCHSIGVSRSVEKLDWFDITLDFKAVIELAYIKAEPPEQGEADQLIGVFYDATLLGMIRSYYNDWMSMDWSLTGLLTAIGVDASLVDVCRALSGDGSNFNLRYEIGNLLNVPLAGLQHDLRNVESWLQTQANGRVEAFGAVMLGVANGYQPDSAEAQVSPNTATVLPTPGLDPALDNGADYPTALTLITRDAAGILLNAALYNSQAPGTGGVRTDHLTIVAGIIRRINLAFGPRDAVGVLKQLCAFRPLPPLPSPSQAAAMATAPVFVMSAPSDVIDANNEFLFAGMVRRLALIQLARAYVAYPYETREEAIAARAFLAEAFSQEILNTGFGQGASDAGVVPGLTAARDVALNYITRTLTTLARLMDVAAPASMPALYYAYRFYGNAERAGELADRNGVFDPLFMPAKFQALSE